MRRAVLKRFKYIIHSFFVSLVFGSYVKRKQDRHSDIDMMFISNDKMVERDVNRILGTLPLNVHLIALNEHEFRSMLHSHESNVVKEAVKSCIILYGIENYYRLLQC